jgi:hypothetical protein
MRPAGRQRLTPVIIATQETEIRRVKVQSQPGEIVPRPHLENTQHRTWLGDW